MFSPAVKPSAVLKAMLSNPSYAAAYSKCIDNVQELTLSRLQEIYMYEYNSLRSRRQQAKARHISFDDRLKDLRDWLTHLGPRPAEGWTVHRINNFKGYVPGNIKWATKLEQTQIRKVTKWHDVNGKLMTTMQLSKHLKLTYTCLYKRLQNGWTIERLLLDSKKQGGIRGWEFPVYAEHVLEPLYQSRKSFNQSRMDWYIAYLKKRLREIQIGNILLSMKSDDEQVLWNELATVASQLELIQKSEREAAEKEVLALISALSGTKALPPDPSPDPSVAHLSDML